jgi:hypothetical protein
MTTGSLRTVLRKCFPVYLASLHLHSLILSHRVHSHLYSFPTHTSSSHHFCPFRNVLVTYVWQLFPPNIRVTFPFRILFESLLKFKNFGYSHIIPPLVFTISNRLANKRNCGRKTFYMRQNCFSRNVQTKTAPAVYNLYNLDVFVGRWSGPRESPCRGPSLQTVARSERSQFSSRRDASMGRNFSLRDERSVACGFDPQRYKYSRTRL